MSLDNESWTSLKSHSASTETIDSTLSDNPALRTNDNEDSPQAQSNLSTATDSEPVVTTDADKPGLQKRHERFYLRDDKVVFLVEETLYSVHRYFFEQYSPDFAVKHKLCDNSQAVVYLKDVKTQEFDQLLSIFYPSTWATPYPETKSVDEWTSVLRLATMWNFPSLRELAVKHLSDIASPIDKISLAHSFTLPDWLPLAYSDICRRDKPLTIEEGRRLGELGQVGVDIVIRLWQASSELKSESSYQDLDAVETVKRVFGLVRTESPPIRETGEVVEASPRSKSNLKSKSSKCRYCKY